MRAKMEEDRDYSKEAMNTDSETKIDIAFLIPLSDTEA